MATIKMIAAKVPTDALALVNRVSCAPSALPADVKHVTIVYNGMKFIFSVEHSDEMVSCYPNHIVIGVEGA